MKHEMLQMIDEINSLTNKISELALQEEWSDISELDETRNQLLKKLYSSTDELNEEDGAELRQFTEELMSSIEETSRLAKDSRDKIRKEIKTISQSQVALSAYSKNLNAS
ncbi:MAG: flagellar protein FliT [Gammaproteobacteria bacterium]|nr:flagellar protein FliT [Gammaproteobacteria bacterium]